MRQALAGGRKKKREHKTNPNLQPPLFHRYKADVPLPTHTRPTTKRAIATFQVRHQKKLGPLSTTPGLLLRFFFLLFLPFHLSHLEAGEVAVVAVGHVGREGHGQKDQNHRQQAVLPSPCAQGKKKKTIKTTRNKIDLRV